MTKRVKSRIGQGASDEVKGEIEIGLLLQSANSFTSAWGMGLIGEKYQREERKEQVDELIHEFDVQKNLSYQGMIRGPHLSKVEERIHGSEESSIEPTPALRYEFGNRVYQLKSAKLLPTNYPESALTRHIGFSRGALDIL